MDVLLNRQRGGYLDVVGRKKMVISFCAAFSFTKVFSTVFNVMRQHLLFQDNLKNLL